MEAATLKHLPDWSSLLENEKGIKYSKHLIQINIQNNEPTVLVSTCLVKHYVCQAAFQ